MAEMIKFAEYNSDDIIARLVANMEAALGETLQPSDERRIFLNQLAQVIVGINANINDTGNQLLLRFARGQVLDELGDFWGVARIAAKTSRTTLKFTLSEAQSTNTTIPKGTRATPDGKTYFATVSALTIEAGSTEGSVEAVCLTAGAEGNGYAIGQIRYIVDNVPFLLGVSNTDVTSGGADAEDDDSLRERIRLAPESLSTAGTVDGYEYYARTASADVGDVVVYAPATDNTLSEAERAAGAGKVFIYILKADGTIPQPNDRVLEDVANAVTAKNVRPLTDFVTVSAPNTYEYNIEVNYYINADDQDRRDEIHAAIVDAVNQYISWQDSKIGRDINPDKLRHLMYNAGASMVEVYNPPSSKLSKTTVAQNTGDIIIDFKEMID